MYIFLYQENKKGYSNYDPADLIIVGQKSNKYYHIILMITLIIN